VSCSAVGQSSVQPLLAGKWGETLPEAPYHKGDGHVTNDTLMTQALIETYAARVGHLDAYAVAEDLVPRLIDEPTWIPELERKALLLQRLFLAEKWLVARIHYGHVDPREAGVGNIVNGAVNAGDPEGAHQEVRHGGHIVCEVRLRGIRSLAS